MLNTLARDVSSTLWLHEDNPTGHYRLDLSSPTHFGAAERLMLANAWQVQCARAENYCDTSQKGNYCFWRNETYNDVAFTCGPDWILPDRGVLELDYASNLLPPALAQGMEDTRAQAVADAFAQSGIQDMRKVRALKFLSTRFWITASQMRSWLILLPTWEAREELLVVLWKRVVDYTNVVDRSLFYNPKFFREGDRAHLFHRLGHLNLLNPLKIEDIVKYRLQLGPQEILWEQRRVVFAIALISSREHSAPDATFDDKVSKKEFVIPATWEKGVPTDLVGYLQVSYRSDHGRPEQSGHRKEICQQFVGWPLVIDGEESRKR